MPLGLEKSNCGKISVCYDSTRGYIITFKCYNVVFAVFKTHFGLPVWRYVFDNPIEVVPGQKIAFDRNGNRIEDMYVW